MLEFGFSNMRFEQNELSNLDVCSNLEYLTVKITCNEEK